MTSAPDSSSARSQTIALIVAASFFMESLDGTVINTALPAIAGSFGCRPLDLSLGITAYLLALAVCVPASGWMAERFGARRVFASALTGFTLASLLCAIAPALPVFIAARVLQGCAAAFMSPVGRLVVLRATPSNRIIEAIATITWPGLIAPVLGPVVGGLLISYGSWRWIFLLNIPLGMLALTLVLRFIPGHAPERPRPLDALGFAITGAALAALVLGLSRLSLHPEQPETALGLVAAGLAAGAIAFRHARRHPSPMLDLDPLRVPTFAYALVGGGLAARLAIQAAPFLLPLMFQVGFGMSAFQAGLMVLVYMAGNLVMKSVTTRLLRRFGFPRVLLVNGLLCSACLFGCAWLAPGQALAWMVLLLLASGMTRSMNFTATNTLAFVDLSPQQRAAATALNSLLQQLALALSVALAAFALQLSQLLRGADHLGLADFHHVWLVVALLMLLASAATRRLHPAAGAAAAA